MKFGRLQNLKDKLLARGDARPSKLRLSAYGKMGFYKDYIMLRSDDGPAADFRHWLDEAFGITFAEFGGKNVRFEGARRLLWALPESRSYMVASVWPSADAGGLRKFPFSLFTSLPRGALLDRSVVEGWLVLEPIWSALETKYAEVREIGAIDVFYETFENQTIEPVYSDETGESEFSFEQWMRALDSESTERFSRRLTRATAELIAGCRDFSDEGADLAVRVPLAASLPMGHQVMAWEQTFVQNLKKCSKWPSMLLPSDPPTHPATLSLIWRDIQREDSRLFAADLMDYENADDLAGADPASQDDGEGEGAVALSEGIDDWIKAVGGR